MKIFVISLERSTQRRKLIQERLGKLGLEFEIVNAIDGRKLTESEIILSTRPLSYAIERGEIGCSLSHLSVYARMIADDVSSALILEDDAIPSQDLPDILKHLEREPVNEPLVTVLTPAGQYVSHAEQQLSITHYIHRLVEGTGAYGYVVNLAAAEGLIRFLYPVWMVSDRWQLIKENAICQIRCVIPPVISHPPYDDGELYKISTVHSDENLTALKNEIWRKIKKKRRFSVKLRRALWLIFARKFIRIEKCS